MARIFLLLVTAVLLAFTPLAALAEGEGGGRVAVLVEIDGAIGPATSEYVRDSFERARERGAQLIIVRLDTPGGLDSAMREIIREILRSPVPVVSFVSPAGARAASAGTYILYASHLAAMAPSTHLGAATPIALGGGFRPQGGEKKGEASRDPAEAKAINDAAAYIRGLAELRGRDSVFAERAVREAATLTAAEAHAQHVVEIIAADLQDLLRKVNGRVVRLGDREIRLDTKGLVIETARPDWRTRVLATITDPTIAYVLLLIGLYGLLFEALNPGAVAPGVIGGICLLVGLYALNLLPVNFAGVALLLLGIALMSAEAFVPSFGVLGLGGITAFALGSLFLFQDVPGFSVSLPVIALAAFASLAFLAVALAVGIRSQQRAVVTGEAVLLGSEGTVLTWLGDEGRGEVRVLGERWHARSAASLVPGQNVRIVRRKNLTLFVEPETGPAGQA
jgi:membrane-bound serine protease (ClpP class)